MAYNQRNLRKKTKLRMVLVVVVNRQHCENGMSTFIVSKKLVCVNLLRCSFFD